MDSNLCLDLWSFLHHDLLLLRPFPVRHYCFGWNKDRLNTLLNQVPLSFPRQFSHKFSHKLHKSFRVFMVHSIVWMKISRTSVNSFYCEKICYSNVKSIKIIHDLTTFTALHTSMYAQAAKAGQQRVKQEWNNIYCSIKITPNAINIRGLQYFSNLRTPQHKNTARWLQASQEPIVLSFLNPNSMRTLIVQQNIHHFTNEV